MKTFILLLRGINVGGKNILPMKELVGLLEALGCTSVKTYIQSGNVVFNHTKSPNAKIVRAIESKFGFTLEIMSFEKTVFDGLVENNPFTSGNGKFIHFYFAAKEPKPNLEKLERFASETERYELQGKVFYLFAPEGIGRSKLVKNIEACLGVPVTGRNLNTVIKLSKLAQNA